MSKGQNLAIEYRWANDQYDRLPDMAAGLARSGVSLIVAAGNSQPAIAAKKATTTIPIVFVIGADPVALGIVESIPRPGGNVTGFTSLATDVNQKRLQLLHDVAPGVKAFGFLNNSFSRGSTDRRTPIEVAQDTARLWGGTIEVANVRAISEFDAAFDSFAGKGVGADAKLRRLRSQSAGL